MKATDKIKIIGLTNNQHIEHKGDGETLLLNKEGFIKSISADGKIFVSIEGVDSIFWFYAIDLKLISS